MCTIIFFCPDPTEGNQAKQLHEFSQINLNINPILRIKIREIGFLSFNQTIKISANS